VDSPWVPKSEFKVQPQLAHAKAAPVGNAVAIAKAMRVYFFMVYSN
jgi:hypothetical protein